MAGVYNAQMNMYNASHSDNVGGAEIIGVANIALAKGIAQLNDTLRGGKLAVADYELGLKALHEMFGEGMADINDARIGAGNAAKSLVAAGFESITYYFGEISRSVSEAATAAAEAAEPIAQATQGIGRMNSMATVFGDSAKAVMQGFYGMIGSGESVLADEKASSEQRVSAFSLLNEGYSGMTASKEEPGSYRSALLVSSAAQIASQVMTTASAAEAAKKLAESTAFANSSGTQIRDASLLMDGIAAYDATSFELTINRLANALDQRKITEAQYVEMLATTIDTFQGVDEETAAVTSSMQSLAKAMSSFADQILIDTSKTTLSQGQTLAEIQRQYEAAKSSAVTGDSDAVSKYQSLANEMIDKSKYESQASYNDAFGKVYGDAKYLEGVGINGSVQNNNVVAELRALGVSLTGRVADLEKALTDALAQIARNTGRTSDGIAQINTVGIPA